MTALKDWNNGSIGPGYANNQPTQEVLDLQNALNDAGQVRPLIPLTGIYSPVTARGVASFQRLVGLPPTGIADIRTIQSMQNEYTGGVGVVPSNKRVAPSDADNLPAVLTPGPVAVGQQAQAGMSTGMMIGLGVGAIVLLKVAKII